MRRLVFPILLAAACSSEAGRTYERNDLQLLTSYAAKEICSCVFVMGQSEDYCAAWAKAAPDLKTFRVDRATGEVEAEAVLFWSRKARYLGRRRGCVLE
jgi:hypothetical protein